MSNYQILTPADHNIWQGQMNSLMTLDTLGAFSIHERPEAITVMLLFR